MRTILGHEFEPYKSLASYGLWPLLLAKASQSSTTTSVARGSCCSENKSSARAQEVGALHELGCVAKG